jgi:hypothetical protein
VLRCCQEEAIPIGVAKLDQQLKKKGVAAGTLLSETDAIDLSGQQWTYALWDLMERYWIPMQTGVGPTGVKPHQLSGQTLTVPDFPQKIAKQEDAGPDDVIVHEARLGQPYEKYKAWYKIGTVAQVDALFTHNSKLMGYDGQGYLVVRDVKTKKEWKMEQDKNSRHWSRMDP